MAIYYVVHDAYDGEGTLRESHTTREVAINTDGPSFGNVEAAVKKKLEDDYLSEFGNGSEGGQPRVDVIGYWKKKKVN